MMKIWLSLVGVKPPLFLTGVPGCGKTYLMYLLFKHLRNDNPNSTMYFRQSIRMFQELLDEKQETQNFSDFKNKLCTCDYLFIDDVLSENLTERMGTEYFEIIDQRIHNKKTFIISSNVSMETFSNSIGERMKDRMKDRMKRVVPIGLPEKSFRGEINHFDKI